MPNYLSFLDATKILKENVYKNNEHLKLLSSFNTIQLELYIKAYARTQGLNLEVQTIPFGTLRQSIISEKNEDKNSILIISPADFSAALDWRTGFPEKPISIEGIRNEILSFKKLIEDSSFKKIFFIPISFPPLFENFEEDLSIDLIIKSSANDLGAIFLHDTDFSLDSYLASGCPISGASLSLAAYKISNELYFQKSDKKKVIVTDLDNTLWNGVVGEDGLKGIHALPEGKGFHHFIFQTYLKKLKEAGTLLSICSKNDEDLVRKAFASNDFVLSIDDFISIQASYNPKSLQIKELAKTLNLGLESFVFIDDNPVEINEVQGSLAQVKCILFSLESSKYLNMYQQLASMFINNNPTEEDINRTKFYQSMKKTIDVIEGQSSDLSSFLKSLQMNIIFSKKTINDSDRAIQLINKTNQFNLNGIRRKPSEIHSIIQNKGFLFTAALSDINGEHGEILSLLINNDNEVVSFVMSCRVFQRKIEYFFLSILLEKYFGEIKFKYIETERNSPVKLFFNSLKKINQSKEITLAKSDIDQAEPNLYDIFNSDDVTIMDNNV